MDTIVQLLLNKFFLWFFGLAKLIGVLVIVYAISYFLSTTFNLEISELFFGTLVIGQILYIMLRMRAVHQRVKKLIESEAANIALAGSAQSGGNQEALAIIERRIANTLAREGLVRVGEHGPSRRVSKKIANALLAQFKHLKGIH